ncbi:MAG: restriction endonuclease subunit S [Pseudomonadota bacterium]|nr:restriction endonuclease subunit S [Pseudomonadota bacterium]
MIEFTELISTGPFGSMLHKSDYVSDGVPLINPTNIVDESIVPDTEKQVGAEALSRLASYVLKAGDLVVGRRGEIGRCAVVGPDQAGWVCGTGCFFISPRSTTNPHFLARLLRSPLYRDQLERASTGTTMKNISNTTLAELPVALPPIDEQRRIVAILDEAFEGLATANANAEKSLQNARNIFDRHLLSVLLDKRWKWATLGDLCTAVEYGSSAKSKAESGVPVLRMGNIQDGRLDWGNLVYTDNQDEIKKYLLKHNDVLFNRTNSPELVGKTAIYKSEMPAIFAGYLIRIHHKVDHLDAEFLTYFLNSQVALDYGNTVVISSVNQANINGTKLKSYPIPMPSLIEQQTIVTKLNELATETQRLARLYRQKLTALDELKKSLLHQAFTGAL